MNQKTNSITWISATDAIPFIGKTVLVSDGEKVTTSRVLKIVPSGDVSRLHVEWETDVEVTVWAFLPNVPVVEKQIPADTDGPSVW
jgi:hypothetical protein